MSNVINLEVDEEVSQKEVRLMARMMSQLSLRQKQCLLWLVSHAVAHEDGDYSPGEFTVQINQQGNTPDWNRLLNIGEHPDNGVINEHRAETSEQEEPAQSD